MCAGEGKQPKSINTRFLFVQHTKQNRQVKYKISDKVEIFLLQMRKSLEWGNEIGKLSLCYIYRWRAKGYMKTKRIKIANKKKERKSKMNPTQWLHKKCFSYENRQQQRRRRTKNEKNVHLIHENLAKKVKYTKLSFPCD